MDFENETAEVTIVIPVYNSADIFPELYKRLRKALDGITTSAEIIAILDGCTDNSYEVISELRDHDTRVKVIEFSRNFGHQSAITAGLRYATGEIVVVMDDDLEDPPEILPEIISKIRDGFDVAYGVRRNRKRSLFYRSAYFLFYRMFGLLSDTKIPVDAGDFCAMRRNVVNTIKGMPEKNKYLRGLRAWSGFNQTGIKYDRAERFAGVSGYDLRRYLQLATNGVLSFSYKPVNVVSTTGLIITSLSVLCGLGLIVMRLLDKIHNVFGWDVLCVVLFLSGIQLLSIGLIGKYIARIHDEVKNRPEYVIRKSAGIDKESTHDRTGT